MGSQALNLSTIDVDSISTVTFTDAGTSVLVDPTTDFGGATQAVILAKTSSTAVTMTAATFLMSILPALVAVSKSDNGPSKLTPKRLSKVFMLCAVNDTSEPSPVPCKPTTKP